MNKAVATGVGIGAVVVIGAAYLGATAWTGRQVEARFQEEAGKLQARYPFVKVSAQSYERGFFKSTSTMAFQLGCPSPDAKVPPAVTVTSVIHHGPLAGGSVAAASVDSELGLSGEAGQKLRTVFGAAAPLSVHTVIGFDRGYRSTVVSPAAKVVEAGQGEFLWQGLSGTVESHGEPRTVSYRIRSPGLSASAADASASLRIGALEINADGKSAAGNGMLMVGASQLSLDSIEVVIKPGSADKPVSTLFTAIKVANDSSLDGDLINGKATLSAAGVVNGAKIEHIEGAMSFKRLHAPTYQRMMDDVLGATSRCDPAAKAAGPAEMIAKMQADTTAMLQYNPEFSLDKLTVDYAGKRGEFSYSFGVQGMTAADAALPPMALASHVLARASARLPVAWIQQIASAGAAQTQRPFDPSTIDVMIDQGVAQGYLVRDGDFVASKVEFNNGQLVVNGKVLPLGGAAAAEPPPPR